MLSYRRSLACTTSIIALTSITSLGQLAIATPTAGSDAFLQKNGAQTNDSHASASAAAADKSASIQSVITCEVHTDDPHYAEHVDGTVNVEGRVWCRYGEDGEGAKANVDRLHIDVWLYRSDPILIAPYEQVGQDSKSNYGRWFLKENAADWCVSDIAPSYYGYSEATAVMPPGFEPHVLDLAHEGNEIFLPNCPAPPAVD